MPVSRDLSRGKRDTLLKWLRHDRSHSQEGGPPLFVEDPSVSANPRKTLKALLRTAIAIEHATIPVYLYALFSIKPGRNRSVAGILRSIVVEEMLHLALACNVLNAIGGEPPLGETGFVPHYPSHLPGDVRPGLQVRLCRLSPDHVRDVLMPIELPAETESVRRWARPWVDSSGVRLSEAGEVEGDIDRVTKAIHKGAVVVRHHEFTIGWYYALVLRFLRALADKEKEFLKGDPGRQITQAAWPGAPGRLYRVTDLKTAVLAVHEIVRQGEGVSSQKPDWRRHELAHYYRFGEIAYGKRYVRTGRKTWDYVGSPVPFEPDGVWPVVDDPVGPYKSKVAEQAAQDFDAGYAELLRSLGRAVTGNPDELKNAIGLMFSLEVQAQRLVQLPVAPGATETAGPRFQVP
jgi:hypothetical protein